MKRNTELSQPQFNITELHSLIELHEYILATFNKPTKGQNIILVLQMKIRKQIDYLKELLSGMEHKHTFLEFKIQQCRDFLDFISKNDNIEYVKLYTNYCLQNYKERFNRLISGKRISEYDSEFIEIDVDA